MINQRENGSNCGEPQPAVLFQNLGHERELSVETPSRGSSTVKNKKP